MTERNPKENFEYDLKLALTRKTNLPRYLTMLPLR
jgi:hypothetical protein